MSWLIYKSAIMNFFRFFFLFKSFVKVELSYSFTINLFATAENCIKSELSYKNRCFFSCWLLFTSRQLFFNINAVVLMVIILRFTKMVKCIPDFQLFYYVPENEKCYF